jgi:hypothetical protein
MKTKFHEFGLKNLIIGEEPDNTFLYIVYEFIRLCLRSPYFSGQNQSDC